MEPLIVTAYLASGLAATDPWSPTLDGILAYWQVRESLGEEEFSMGMTGHRAQIEAAPPLAREEHDGEWWWQSSSPIYETATRYRRATHRRFDDYAAYDRVPESVRRVEVKGGPYKAARIERVMAATPWVRWHCVGDAAEVRRLLRLCANIGYGHTRGYGQVTRWDVAAGGDPEIARFRRPVPMAFAEAHGLGGPRMEWGIRPPARDHRALCVMPQ